MSGLAGQVDVKAAVEAAYDDCIAVAKDFTGQGVLIVELLKKHKAQALGEGTASP